MRGLLKNSFYMNICSLEILKMCNMNVFKHREYMYVIGLFVPNISVR